MVFSQTSQFAGYLPDSVIGHLHYFCKWIEHQLYEGKPRQLLNWTRV